MIFEFKGCHEASSKCDLDIRQTDIGTVVMITELADNQGTTITNAAEILLKQVCEHYGLTPNEIIWIEHYSEDWIEGQKESFDIVTFNSKVFGSLSANWKRITLEDARSLQSGDNHFPGIDIHALETEVYCE